MHSIFDDPAFTSMPRKDRVEVAKSLERIGLVCVGGVQHDYTHLLEIADIIAPEFGFSITYVRNQLKFWKRLQYQDRFPPSVATDLLDYLGLDPKIEARVIELAPKFQSWPECHRCGRLTKLAQDLINILENKP